MSERDKREREELKLRVESLKFSECVRKKNTLEFSMCEREEV